MLIRDVIKLAVEGELNQLAVKDEKATVIGFINMGILEIFKRFDLYRKEAIFTVLDGVSTYTLDGEDVNVTMDMSDHEFLMVKEAFDSLADELTLNDRKDKEGISTPSYNVVKIGEDVEVGEVITITYQATPNFRVEEKDILPIPPQFLEALLHYIGYRGHGSLKGEETPESNSHYRRFNASCNKIKTLGLQNEDELASDSFEQRGFA